MQFRKLPKLNKIPLSPVVFLHWRVLGTVEMKMEAMGLEDALLYPAKLGVHGGSQAQDFPSPADAPVILGHKEADCTGMVDKSDLKEHIIGKFSFFNLGTEVGSCPLWYLCLNNNFLMKTKYSCGITEWLPESCPTVAVGHSVSFI